MIKVFFLQNNKDLSTRLTEICPQRKSSRVYEEFVHLENRKADCEKQRTQGSDKSFSKINKDLSTKLTEICPQRKGSRVSSSWSARQWMNPLFWWVRNIIIIMITIGVKNKSTLKQRHSRRKRTPAHCGSTTSMQAATSIHLTGQKLLPKLFCRLYVSVWKWQIVRWSDRLKDFKGWKWRTRGKYEDVMKMTNTRMIKWIAVLTSTQTWSWSGLSFVLERRGGPSLDFFCFCTVRF